MLLVSRKEITLKGSDPSLLRSRPVAPFVTNSCRHEFCNLPRGKLRSVPRISDERRQETASPWRRLRIPADGVDPPLTGHALQRLGSAIKELKPRAHDQVFNGARD